MNHKASSLLPVLLVIFCTSVLAQRPVEKTPATDTIQIVNILHADRLGFSKKDTANIVQYGAGNVSAQQANTLFYSDSAVMNQKSKIFEAFGKVHINDDSIDIYSQYLRYYFHKKLAILQRDVRLTDGKSNLTTNELEYDMNLKVGIYKNGGKVVNGSSVLTSKEGIYYADMKEIFFRKNVVLIDPKYKLYADSLLYNTETEVATFIGPTRIIDGDNREIITREGFYDLKNRVAQFGKRSQIKDGSTSIVADEIFSDDQTGVSTARGRAVYKDTAEGISVIANLLESNQRTGELMATLKPLMIIRQDQDSIYVTADTILSGKLDAAALADSAGIVDTLRGRKMITSNGDSSKRYLKAYHHVRIFSDSLQAVSDSLYYSGLDSIFRLFKDPVIWASENQITGDTVFLFTRNQKPDRLYVFENALVVSKAGPNFYNQIKGNTLDGIFKDGVIDYMRARGNAESIYFVKDEDSAYVGANRSTSDIIDLRFRNKQLNKVVFISEVKGTTIPFRQIDFDEMRLRNFKWLEARRPKTRFELFGD